MAGYGGVKRWLPNVVNSGKRLHHLIFFSLSGKQRRPELNGNGLPASVRGSEQED
jgi:hypothetical protein